MTNNEIPADLSAQVDDLRSQVLQLRGIVTAWDARLNTDVIGKWMVLQLGLKHLGEALPELQAEVQHLAEALAKAVSKNRLAPPPAPYWLGLPRAEYAAQLAKLREWVDKIARTQYPEYLAKLPSCWPNHPEAIWELSNLMMEWVRIYGDEDNQDLAGALWFHERWMPGVLTRLAKAIRCDEAGCRRSRQVGEPW
jgi:hypothetical protein